MCRLYGFQANEPTKIECSLVHAQNALLDQGIQDAAGLTHGHGWGIGVYPDGIPVVVKKSWAAWHGEHFKKVASRVYSYSVIAHVRRATVGPPAVENTHPFSHGRWLFAHNGTIHNFDAVRPFMLEATDFMHREEIHGSTDSEHIFRYFLTLWQHHPERPIRKTMSECIRNILAWSHDVSPAAPPALNLLLTDGHQMVGSRLGRTLWFIERDHIDICEICGKSHVDHDPSQPYRAVEIASEPITHEKWLGVPDATVFSVDPDMRLNFEDLGDIALSA